MKRRKAKAAQTRQMVRQTGRTRTGAEIGFQGVLAHFLARTMALPGTGMDSRDEQAMIAIPTTVPASPLPKDSKRYLSLNEVPRPLIPLSHVQPDPMTLRGARLCGWDRVMRIHLANQSYRQSPRLPHLVRPPIGRAAPRPNVDSPSHPRSLRRTSCSAYPVYSKTMKHQQDPQDHRLGPYWMMVPDESVLQTSDSTIVSHTRSNPAHQR